ncbi:MAG: NAD(P)/FAD-dependent oxidoreductase [Gammaproteobacteria bacterium]|nr:NAD(P)/FAD-dependent oxidoreductase [Gammaproteobacteria bacterium]NNL99221.1 NAD(P)/FAD-dependent oxidoreductase [Gammaproteobacteria bacterium]
MTDFVDSIVIGAGVVGLAVARELALRGRRVIVLERHGAIGTETSSRNSEVIHAGIYYAPGSLKARLCVAGRHALYAYCQDRRIPHRRLGKLIVASNDDEVATLRDYARRAERNGVTDLEWLDAPQVAELEPDIVARRALFSPSTGIVDSHALMLALQGDIENHGGHVVLRSEAITVVRQRAGFLLRTSDGDEISCGELVNAAGLGAWDVAGTYRDMPGFVMPARYFAKGHYYAMAGASPFSHLVYPVAKDGGLGVHVTIDMGGQARFGPDLRWVEGIDYSFDDSRREQFSAAIRRYFPAIDDRELAPSYTGIRPRLAGPGEGATDFMIQTLEQHRQRGLVNLFGIESPGLTSSLALAAAVADELERDRQR